MSEAIKCWNYKKSIKGHNKYENSDLSKLEESYNDFVDSLSDTLVKFKVSEIDILSCEVTNQGYLNVTVDVEYDYTVKYSFLGQEETKEKEKCIQKKFCNTKEKIYNLLR